MRPLNDFQPEKWEVSLVHMRIRANLTGAEHRAIRAFVLGLADE